LATATINGYLLGALSGLEAFSRLAYAGVWSGLSVIALVCLGAWLGGLNGSIIGLSGANLLRMLIHYAALRRELRSQQILVSYPGSLQAEKSTFLAFTAPAALSGYLTIPAIWFCNTLLIRQQDGLEQMALFAAANSIRTIVTFLPLTANAVMVSIINNLLAETSAARLQRVSRNHVAMTAVITICLAGIVALLAPYLLRAFGPSFGAALTITYILIAATLGETLNSAFYQVVQARGNMWKIPVYVVAPREGLLVALAFLLIPHFGGAGLAAAYLVSFLFGSFVAFIIARRT
jgi:O-antigen/teichoic acid export membrane protein